MVRKNTQIAILSLLPQFLGVGYVANFKNVRQAMFLNNSLSNDSKMTRQSQKYVFTVELQHQISLDFNVHLGHIDEC